VYKAAWFSRRFLPAEGGVERFLGHLAQDVGRDYKLNIYASIFDNKPDTPGCDDLFARKGHYIESSLYKVRAIQPTMLQRILLLPCGLVQIPFLRSRFYQSLKKFAAKRFASVYLKKVVKKSKKCVVVHSFAFGGIGLLAKKTADELQVPFVITPFMHKGRWGDAPHDIELYNSADAVIALHEQDKESLIAAGVYRDIIRICGIGIPSFSGDGEAFRLKHGIKGIMVLFVGRLVAHKGWNDLCYAIDKINKTGKDVTLVLIGPQVDESEELTAYIKLPYIKYLGILSEDEKHDAFFACDLFCLPSVSEIFPVTILEAWHSRKPVVVYNTESVRVIIKNNETGRIVSPDREELTKVLLNFVESRSAFSTLGPDGRQELDSKYRIALIASWHRDLYDELISRGRESTQFNKQINS
jgi:glycosyltransferase involved in cell wall biosynthesis